MEEIVAILTRRIGDEDVSAVEARELHEKLESKRDFATWFVARVDQLDLTEGVDFERFIVPPNGGAEGNRGVRHEYVLSLDAAKHVALAERTDRGKRVRAYFIEAEKRMRTLAAKPAPVLDLRDPAQRLVALHQALELLNESEAKVATLTAEVETKTTALAIVTPKAEVFDAFIDSNGLYLLMNAARALHQPPKLFIAALREAKVLTYEHGELVARAHYTDAKDANGVPMGKGYFTHRPYTFPRSGGTRDSRLQIYVTPLGLAWLGRCVTSGRLVIESKSKRARARAQRGAAA